MPGHDNRLYGVGRHTVDPAGAGGIEPHLVAQSRYDDSGGRIGLVGEIAYFGDAGEGAPV